MKIVLKPGKEKPINQRHHWIFSGAISRLPDNCNGEIVPVYSSQNVLLGHAYLNTRVNIVGRMISFGNADPLIEIERSLKNAIALRNKLIEHQSTNAYRLINGEGDGLPGLIVDKYRNTLVLQIYTLGMDRLKDFLIKILVDELNPDAIYEKSSHGSRIEEGLEKKEGVVYGSFEDRIEIKENNLTFILEIAKGQKTGFFLDQRNMREMVRSMSAGKRVLNCFSYTGGFSVYALSGGASWVDSVDSSSYAVNLAGQNISINGHANHQSHECNVFDFLKEREIDHDFVILDPPAFAKGRKDVKGACKGYKDLNTLALRKMKSGSMLLTCSCSGQVDSSLFQKLIFQSALDAGKELRIIGRHQIACDHPINVFHPETDYLKSLLLYIA